MSPVSSTFAGASARGYGMFTAISATWLAYLADTSAAGSQNTTPFATMFDSSGNTYSCGTTLTDAFVVKFNKSGAITWQRKLSADASVRDVAVDASGNVYVTGSYAVVGGSRAFVAKYDSTGTLTWHKYLVGSAGFNNDGYGVVVDSSGNVYACGSFRNASGGTNAYLVKLDSAGAITWQRSIVDSLAAASQQDIARMVTLDGSGNPHVTGTFATAGPVSNGFVAKYDTSGTLQWQRSIGSTSNAIGIDSSGNVNIGGWWTNGSTGINAFTAQYTSSGTLSWQRALVNGALAAIDQNDIVNSISVDSAGNVYSVGIFYTATGSNGFIAKYNSSGALQYQRKFDDATDTVNALDVAVDTEGYMRVAVGFGNSSGGANALASKLSVNGSPTGSFAIDGTHSVTYDAGALTDAAGSLTGATSTLTSAASSLTTGNSALTDAAGSLTSAAIAI